MPLGHVCAHVAHAAGESFYYYAQLIQNPDAGLPNIIGSGTVAVVLGVRDEKSLRYYAKRLYKQGIRYDLIIENAGPFAGQATAIGVIPTADRAKVFKVLKKLNPISTCDEDPKGTNWGD